MPTIHPAAAAVFGVTGDELFQGRTVSMKMDKKEASDNNGEIIGRAFHGKMAEHSIEVLGVLPADYTLGAQAVPANISAALTGTTFCVDELNITRNHDGFATGSIKVSEYVIED